VGGLTLGVHVFAVVGLNNPLFLLPFAMAGRLLGVYAHLVVGLRAARAMATGAPARFDALSDAVGLLPRYVLAVVIAAAITAVWSMAFVLPGLFAAICYLPLLGRIVTRRESVADSVGAAWRQGQGSWHALAAAGGALRAPWALALGISQYILGVAVSVPLVSPLGHVALHTVLFTAVDTLLVPAMLLSVVAANRLPEPVDDAGPAADPAALPG
jgi:hypothetical protein